MPRPDDETYPGRLHHRVPGWVAEGAIFHIRVRTIGTILTEPSMAAGLIESAKFYHREGTWYAALFMLMPDHLHALLGFPSGVEMSKVVGAWKGFQTKTRKVQWQDGYFDHRIRNQQELAEKWNYIRMNPVAKGLCADPDDWEWWWTDDGNRS